MSETTSIERLAHRLGIERGTRQVGGTTLVRLVGYYIVVLVVIAGFILLTSDMKARMPANAGKLGPGITASSGEPGVQDLTRGFWTPLFHALPPLAYGAAAVIGAFLLAIPVAFTYVRTRNSLKYDQSLVQTVIMLPVVVTAILIVVENSLALAFSLAGIVAAVRFRSNLKDNRDAVYIFAAVGIGFAAGVGTLAIATFLSVFFCVLELLLWKLDLTADHEQTFGRLCLPAGSTPGSGPSGLVPTPVPSADTNLLALGGGKPGAGSGKKPYALLRLYVTDPAKAQPLIETVLNNTARAFKYRRARRSGNDQYVLEYQVRPRKKSSIDQVLASLYREVKPFLIAGESGQARTGDAG